MKTVIIVLIISHIVSAYFYMKAQKNMKDALAKAERALTVSIRENEQLSRYLTEARLGGYWPHVPQAEKEIK